MNTSALKSFAPAVRRQLMEAVTRKLDYVLTADTADLRQAANQIAALRKEAARYRAALIERVAYTWFNRFAALRFLDARGWHPFKARVLTPASADETQPELLKLVRTGSLPDELKPHTDLARLNDLLDGRLPTAIAGADPQGEVYRHLVLAACRIYHALLPDLFEKLNDETELLLPDDLLTAASVAEGFRTEITDEDCSEVELLGWLYQFYISEKKDSVMARKSAVPTEDIPAVTQLFTPHWIVRYLVENSLGRLWLLNRPGSRLRDHMPYYIEGEAETDFLKITKPEEIRLCDPAVGSGHMLTYAFDLLTLIYEEEGYAPTEIPALILRHNLHGLEICPRAAQLAELALVFKAREKSRRFFQPEHLVRPHIIELRDVRFDEGELPGYFKALGCQPSALHPQLAKLLHQFEESKNFGSLIQPCLTEAEIQSVRLQIHNPKSNIQNSDLMVGATHLKVLRVLEKAEALTQRYHVVVANPPYMGNKAMSGMLKTFLEDSLNAGRPDLFSAFIQRITGLVLNSGFAGMITMHSWMFLKTFEELRELLLKVAAFQTIAHLGPRAFDSISGEVVQTVAFIFCASPSTARRVVFFRLVKGTLSSDKEELLLRSRESGESRHLLSQAEISRMPGKAFLYWLPYSLRQLIEKQKPLGEIAQPRQGLATADNARFLRRWSEVASIRLGLGFESRKQAQKSKKRWFPYNKGGEFRKWYGNNEFVVDWENDGERIFGFRPRSVIRNPDFYFRKGITWTDISPGAFGARAQPHGFVFDVSGSCVFTDDMNLFLAYFASRPVFEMLSAFNPTLHFQVGNIADLPAPDNLPADTAERHRGIATDAVTIARADWDNFETSWDFRDQPLLRPGLKGATLEASWRNWEAQSTAAIRRMQELETENNRLFIAAYGLEGELQPEVPEEQITLARADVRRDMAAFLSYAVGCMMGRYSPHHPGIILANAGDTLENFRSKIADSGLQMEDLSFAPDDDAIIPVLEGEWFDDDIVTRTRAFLRATFGDATLNENLRFMEESLGKSLEKYFLTDFYKDHLQTYKKRPIYWLFQSPKRGFSALIYLHRYTRDTANTLLNKYLRDYLHKLENRLTHLVHVEATGENPREKTAARKEADRLRKTLKECQDWEREVLLPLAQQRLEIDLDDGVKVNYLKFGDALAPIAGLAAKEEQ